MDQYQIILKRTDELTKSEWGDYTEAFNSIFKKKYSTEYFKIKYSGTIMGYSYHGVLFFEKKIVGMFTVIPSKYIYSDHEITIGLGCDAFILKEHRKDEYFLKEMADVVTEKFKDEGVTHFISIPNKSAYPYWIYYGNWKDIGKLNYYILPLRISKIISKFGFLDNSIFFLFKTMISFLSNFGLMSNKSISKAIYLKRDNEYFANRYPNDYIIHKMKDNSSFVYRTYLEDSIRTAYLIDCFPLSPKNITIALSQIIKETKGKIDIVLFVGIIDNPPFFFFKVPVKKEPRAQPFIGLSLDDTLEIPFLSITSWDVSMANFDNR